MWTKLWIAAVVVASTCAAGWLTYDAGRKMGRSEVQQKWDQERAATAEAQAAETMKARQRELALQELAKRLRQEKADEARRLAREYAADLERLRDRPETRAGAGGVPDSPGAGVGCTGAGLARPDAAFLTGYAYDAARLEASLRQCVSAYNSVREALNGSH
jgi:multidrug efflux pump subunit AcrA (membrane-fusion protein)